MQEVPELNELYGEYSEKGLEILGVNLGEGKEAIQSVIDENGIKYRILLGTEDVGFEYNVQYIPLSVLVDKEGKILFMDNPLPEKELIEKSIAE